MIRIAQGLGYRAFPFLPKPNTKYPFIVIDYTQVLPRPTKTALIGTASASVSVWSDLSDRKQVSDMIAKLFLGFSKIKQIENTQWSMDLTSSSQIIKDTTTDAVLYHGIMELTFKFM